MTLKIKTKPWKQIKKHTKKLYPKEAPAILLGKKENNKKIINKTIKTENPKNSTTSFTINPKKIIQILENNQNTNQKLIGFYHSHPNQKSYVSKKDKKYMKLWPKKSWIIASTDKRGKIKNIKSFKYIKDEIKEEKIKY